MRYYWVDLHIHTALSPCGELEMGAPEIVEKAREEGIDVIAISDHNTCDNFPAIAAKAAGNPLVLPALEVQTAEDIHVLSIFPDYERTKSFKEHIWETMPPTPNNPDIFGYQVIIDENNDIVGTEDTLLIQGIGIDVDTLINDIHRYGGLAILAHIDRPSFSYTSVLGPFPTDYPADAFELSWKTDSQTANSWREQYPGRTFIRSSDSHWLDTLSKRNCTKMMLQAPTFDEISLALQGREGRRISWPWG